MSSGTGDELFLDYTDKIIYYCFFTYLDAAYLGIEFVVFILFVKIYGQYSQFPILINTNNENP